MQKKIIGKLEKCYSIAPITYKKKRNFLVAAEKIDRCIMFDEKGEKVATVWNEPGGVMSMVQVPGNDGQFLATHKFYSPNDSKDAKIVVATPNESGEWDVKTVVELPFVHRFDILNSKGELFLIACTLKSDHKYKDDWTSPGKVYAAKLPKDLAAVDKENQLKLEVLKEGMLKNHGYYKVIEDGAESSLVSSENGVFRFYPPTKANPKWRQEQILDSPASDATMIDLDGDGKLELIVIAPFHGNEISIYKSINNKYEKVFVYPEKAEFLHAVWSGELAGRRVAVLGHRKGARRLIAFMWDGEKYCFKTIDDDCGPANVLGYSLGDEGVLIAANREIDEIAMYIFQKGDL